jgi:hypothetical protein
MKPISILCLITVILAALSPPAEAGRGRRVARRVGVGVAVAAGAGAGAGVAAGAVAARRTTVVAAAPVVVAAPVAVRTTPAVVALPDLAVVDLRCERDVLVIVVKNIGRAPSPLCSMNVDLRRPEGGPVVASHVGRIAPLAVGQSVRIRLSSAPLDGVHATVRADALDEVAEMDELNNARLLPIAARPITPPQTIEEEAEWQSPGGSSETIPAGVAS